MKSADAQLGQPLVKAHIQQSRTVPEGLFPHLLNGRGKIHRLDCPVVQKCASADFQNRLSFIGGGDFNGFIRAVTDSQKHTPLSVGSHTVDEALGACILLGKGSAKDEKQAENRTEYRDSYAHRSLFFFRHSLSSFPQVLPVCLVKYKTAV